MYKKLINSEGNVTWVSRDLGNSDIYTTISGFVFKEDAYLAPPLGGKWVDISAEEYAELLELIIENMNE